MTVESILGIMVFPVAYLAFAIFVMSGLGLIYLGHRKFGERERQLTARLARLEPAQEARETLPSISPPEVTALYREDGAVTGWRKLSDRAVPIGLALIILLPLTAVAFMEFPHWTAAVLGLAIVVTCGYGGYHFYRRSLMRKKFIEQLPEAIDIIIRGARVGMSLQENFQVIATEMPDPVGRQFRTLAEKLGIGIDLETALASAVEEVGVKELQFMATTLILQRRTGGQYAEVLENLARVLRDRRAQFLKAKALTSESRVSARIVAIVTAVILIILALTNRAQFDFLFDDPLGHDLLIYSGISIGIGFFTLSRLLRTLQ
jgi:Flp pilus assembly protein TadB